jgi:hypothetical protein
MLNVVLGVWLLYWVVVFTEWGEGVLSLLALGGALSWVAVVVKILPETRQKQIQAFLADLLLESRKAWIVIGALAALTVATFCVGVVEVSNLQGGDALVSVDQLTPAPTGAEPLERVPVGARSRTTFLMWPWTRSPIRVKVQRLPAREFDLRPWWAAGEKGKRPTRPLQVPGSFLQPVVVVAGGSFAQRNPKNLQLEIYVNDEPKYSAPFTQKAVLLGAADADIAFPDRLRTADGWREVLAQYADRVLPPLPLAIPLKEGARVRAALVGAGGSLENVLIVGPVWEPADMVQGLLVVTAVPEKKP